MRRRATGGAALMVARGALILAFGVGANIALARLLQPRDFGVVALGTVLLVVGGFLSDGGLGAGLIRRIEPPTRRELEAVNAMQIALTLGFAALAAAIGFAVGRDGLVVAAMVATLPITILKSPSNILLERELRYSVIATVDVIEALAFYSVALVTVAAGMGVWGFAAGMAVRATAGTTAMALRGPVGIVRPRWSWTDVRPLLRFGAKFQAVVVIALARDQGLNVGIALVAGVATLGVWNLTWRVLQVPFMVFGTLGRIGYPTMARLLSGGHDARPVIERGVAAITVVTAGIVVALAGLAPALPALVGAGWSDVSAVLLWAGIGMIAGTPIFLACSGYLFAANAPGVVLAASVGSAVAWVAVALPLAPSLGAPAAGIGWCAGAVVMLAVLVPGVTRVSKARVTASFVGPAGTGIAATAIAWLVARAAGRSVPAGLLGAVLGEALLFAGLVAFAPRGLRDTRVILREALASFRGRIARPRVPLTAEPPAHAPPQATT